MKKIFLTACLVFIAYAGVGAQTIFQDEEFFVPPPEKAPWLLDWGSTLTAAGLYAQPGFPDNAVAGVSGVFWTRLSLPAHWQFYGRLRGNVLSTLLPWPSSDFSFLPQWEINACYLQLTESEGGITLAFGRKPFLLGSGLVLSGNGDGFEIQMANPWFTAKALMFYTGLLNPYFASDNTLGTRRYFGAYSIGSAVYGVELSLLGMYQSDFIMGNDDIYTSWYTGLRARGVFFGGEFLTEWFIERGKSPSGSAVGGIEAFGGTCRFHRVFDFVTSPTITIQYSLASGDGDRSQGIGSAGNASGADTAFQAFGEIAAGSVFDPHFSNIHIAYVEASFSPLEVISRRFKGAVAGLRYFYYAKHEAAGVVNENDAAVSEAFLGHGLDLVLRWMPFSDVSAFATAGMFIPGAAFPSGEALRFVVSAGLSVTL